MDRIEPGQLRTWNDSIPGGGELILIVGRTPEEEVGGDVWWDYLQDGVQMSAPDGLLLDRSRPS